MQGYFQEKKFISSIRPLFYVSRFLGLAPFSFTSNFAVKEVGPFWLLYTIVVLITVLSCSITCIVVRMEQPSLLVAIHINEFLSMFVGGVTAFSSICISITLNGVKSRNIVSKVIKIDKELLNDSSTTYTKTIIFTLIQVILVYGYTAVLFTYDTVLWTTSVEEITVWYIVSSFPHRLINIEPVVEFCDLVLLLINRIKALNSSLSLILRGSNETDTNAFVFTTASSHSVPKHFVKGNAIRVPEINRDKIVPFIDSTQSVNHHRPLRFELSKHRKIRRARELYDDLCDISVLINSMYNFQILLELGLNTAELTLCSHLMIATIVGIHAVDAEKTGRFICLMAAWQMLHSFKLICVTVPCQFATTEVENTVVLVQKLLLEEFDQNTMAELQLFSQQLLHRKMNFTAFGFLKLDCSLLLTIYGGVITYVVLAMQFGK
jgi:hypothetical protein